jgi:hypothetical protein
MASARKPAIGGLFWRSGSGSHERQSGWLGREGSNLRMAESKSDYFTNDFNAHSEKRTMFVPKCINRLVADSE